MDKSTVTCLQINIMTFLPGHYVTDTHLVATLYAVQFNSSAINLTFMKLIMFSFSVFRHGLSCAFTHLSCSCGRLMTSGKCDM